MPNQKEPEWEWIKNRILAEKDKHENLGNNEWAEIAARKISSDISVQIAKAREEIASKILKKVMESFGVKVKDMPAFSPSKMTGIGLVCLATKIGIQKAKKEERAKTLEEVERMFPKFKKIVRGTPEIEQRYYDEGFNSCIRQIKEKLKGL